MSQITVVSLILWFMTEQLHNYTQFIEKCLLIHMNCSFLKMIHILQLDIGI